MSLYVSVIRYNANIVPQDIQDLISYPDLLLTKLCQHIFFKCFFFSVGICFWLAVLLMAWDQTTLQNVRPPVLVGRRFPVMPRQKNGWTTRIYRNTSEDPELLKKRTLSTCQGNWHGIANWEHFFTSPDRDDPPPTHTHTPTPVFEWPFEPHESLFCLKSKDYAFFLNYLKTTMSIGPVPGIKPATFSFRSVKKIGVLS